MRLDHQANSPRLHHSVASPAQSMGEKPFRLPEKMEYNFHPLKQNVLRSSVSISAVYSLQIALSCIERELFTLKKQ